MSRDKRYQRLLNDKRWMEVKRIVWQRAKGLCEECMKHDIVRTGVDCHHIVPVESATTIQEMERLCYNPDNIRLLCIPCHSSIHKSMGKGTRKLAAERAKARQDRWAEGLMQRFVTKPSDHNQPDPPTT